MSRKQYKSFDGKWNHVEHRTGGKVSLADFYAVRLNAIEIPYGETFIAQFMYSPVNMARDNLRDQVRGNAKQLASRTAKFLTMNSEYIARRSFAKARLEKEPDLQTRLNRLSGSYPPARPVNMSKWPSGLPIKMGSGFTQLPVAPVVVVAGLVPYEPACQERVTAAHKVAWRAAGRIGYLTEIIATAGADEDTSAERAELIDLESPAEYRRAA
jgi:hypothetical protein